MFSRAQRRGEPNLIIAPRGQRSASPAAGSGNRLLLLAESPCSIDATTQSGDEETIQNALDLLDQLFACEPDKIVEAFAKYFSTGWRHLDGPGEEQRRERISAGAILPSPPDRQVRIETAAKDHVIHLETMVLAEEQDVPNASAAGQILTSGGRYGRPGKGSHSIRSQSTCETPLRVVFKLHK